MALDRLFAGDRDDGSLDLILMGRAPLELVVAAKGLAHWLTTGLPLVICAPLIGLLLNLDLPEEGALMLTLFVGTPALTFIGLIGAAIAVTLRRGGLLLGGHRAAADRPDPDLRRRRRQCSGQRPDPVRHAIYDPLRADAGESRGRTVRRRRGVAARNGMKSRAARWNGTLAHAKVTAGPGKPHCITSRHLH